MNAATASSPRYEQLLERALEFVEEHSGAVHEDLLIRHVFGSNANPDLWRSLIRQVLRDSDALGLRADGFWSLVSRNGIESDSDSLLAQTFVVIDVETTGLRPYQHRMIEFGAIRFCDGVATDSLSVLLNPERPLPVYIRRLTGIDDGMLADAPLFRVVSEQILEFIGDDLVVGYNTSFDVSFINAELKRIDAEPIINEQIDLLPVASSLLPGSRARGLDSLARELNITVGRSHRALDDARTTGEILVQLIPRMRSAGIRELSQLTRFRGIASRSGNRNESVGRGRSVLDARHIESVPSTAGVYVMRTASNRVIYVGKAKDLRARIRSYYSQPLGYTRKMDGLLQSIDRIETIETGSELAALLLEAQLISRYQPQFNRQLRTSDSYPYIRIDIANPWPRVSLARESADDGALYYGPYRSSRSARATVDALNDIFPLRTCTRSFKTAKSYGSPCPALDLKQCLGPCTGLASPDEYRGYVRQIIDFLDGDINPVIQRLHDQLEETAARLDFERAARIRKRIERVSELAQAQKVLSEAIQEGNLAIVLHSPESDAREILLVHHGRSWARRTIRDNDADSAIIEDLSRSWRRAQSCATDIVMQHELDSIQIVSRWVRNHWDHPSIVNLDPHHPDWQQVIEVARTIDPLP